MCIIFGAHLIRSDEFAVHVVPDCREDWKPVLTINSIIYGLQYLFLVCEYTSTVSVLEFFS